MRDTTTNRRILMAAAVFAMVWTLLPPGKAYAAIVPACATQSKEVPSLNCALQTFGNVAQLILGVTGSFALLMFIYGGFLMLTSGGSQDRVTKGRTVLTNAVIGIVIILTSGTLLTYGLSKLRLATKVVGAPCETGGVYALLPDGEYKCVTNANPQKK